jgi:hypothetical protein
MICTNPHRVGLLMVRTLLGVSVLSEREVMTVLFVGRSEFPEAGDW